MQTWNLKKQDFLWKSAQRKLKYTNIFLKDILIITTACYMRIKVLLWFGLVWFGFVILLYTKQTEDGGPVQRKPLAASAIQ